MPIISALTIRLLKIIFGVLLITLGLLYEVAVYIELSREEQTAISQTSEERMTPGYYYPPRPFPRGPRYVDPEELIPRHNYHHFLFASSMIAGALLLASVKEQSN